MARIASREANFEALRVLAMFMIVLEHCLLFIGENFISRNDAPLSFLASCVTFPICFGLVNAFVLVSGYFIAAQKDSAYPWRKMISLWFVVIFYSLGLYACSVLIFKSAVSVESILLCGLPIISRHYWFITVYLALLSLSPFLVRFAHALDKKSYTLFLIIFFLLSSVFVPDEFDGGFSLIWFVFLFFLGGYIRLHKAFVASPKRYLLLSFFVLAALSVYVGFLSWNINLVLPKEFGYYCNPFVLVLSVLSFLIFKNIKLGEKMTKVVLAVSPTVFGIYLIHEHHVFFRYLWTQMNMRLQSVDYLFLFGLAVAIFAFCMVVEKLRLVLFKVLPVDKWFADAIEGLYRKIQKRLCSVNQG